MEREFTKTYTIRYNNIFQADKTQDAIGKNPCVLFSIYNAMHFVQGKNADKSNWDGSFKEIQATCTQVQTFCNDMQEFRPVIDYLSRHIQKQDVLKPEVKECKQIVDFLKILDENFNSRIISERCGIAFLIGTFASVILIDNKNKLIHIRDSHIKDQYTVDNTGDLYKHLLTDTYFVNIDKESHQRTKILCAIYKSKNIIDREKAVKELSDDDLIKDMYSKLNMAPADQELIVNAIFHGIHDPLKKRITQYMTTNNINKDISIIYPKFTEYAKKQLGFYGGGNYKQKYLKYKKKYLALKNK